jgi:hypothetical protein
MRKFFWKMKFLSRLPMNEFLDISIKFPFDDLAQIAISVLVLLPFSNWSGLLAK